MHADIHRNILRKSGRLSAMPFRQTTFPLAEGIGIFVGIIAWDLLSEGRTEVLKALLISVPCTLAWFAVRCWKQKTGSGRADPPVTDRN